MSGAKTGHVMVPIPEGLVDQVSRYLTWAATMGSQARALDPGAVDRLLDRSDEMQGAMLGKVAEAEDFGGEAPSIDDLAIALGCESRELIGAMVELNNLWSEAWTSDGRPPFLLTFQQIGPADLPLGQRTAIRMSPMIVAALLSATGRGRVIEELDDESDV